MQEDLALQKVASLAAHAVQLLRTYEGSSLGPGRLPEVVRTRLENLNDALISFHAIPVEARDAIDGLLQIERELEADVPRDVPVGDAQVE